jgi:hypothetical protein
LEVLLRERVEANEKQNGGKCFAVASREIEPRPDPSRPKTFFLGRKLNVNTAAREEPGNRERTHSPLIARPPGRSPDAGATL